MLTYKKLENIYSLYVKNVLQLPVLAQTCQKIIRESDDRSEEPLGVRHARMLIKVLEFIGKTSSQGSKTLLTQRTDPDAVLAVALRYELACVIQALTEDSSLTDDALTEIIRQDMESHDGGDKGVLQRAKQPRYVKALESKLCCLQAIEMDSMATVVVSMEDIITRLNFLQNFLSFANLNPNPQDYPFDEMLNILRAAQTELSEKQTIATLSIEQLKALKLAVTKIIPALLRRCETLCFSDDNTQQKFDTERRYLINVFNLNFTTETDLSVSLGAAEQRADASGARAHKTTRIRWGINVYSDQAALRKSQEPQLQGGSHASAIRKLSI